MSKTIELKFKEEFTSPVLGYVWIGRVAAVERKHAKRLIDGGYADEYDAKEEFRKTVDSWEKPVNEEKAKDVEATDTAPAPAEEQKKEVIAVTAETAPRVKRKYTRKVKDAPPA